jgi:hypothetical protein
MMMTTAKSGRRGCKLSGHSSWLIAGLPNHGAADSSPPPRKVQDGEGAEMLGSGLVVSASSLLSGAERTERNGPAAYFDFGGEAETPLARRSHATKPGRADLPARGIDAVLPMGSGPQVRAAVIKGVPIDVVDNLISSRLHKKAVEMFATAALQAPTHVLFSGTWACVPAKLKHGLGVSLINQDAIAARQCYFDGAVSLDAAGVGIGQC